MLARPQAGQPRARAGAHTEAMISTITGALSGLGRRFSFTGVLPFVIVTGYLAILGAVAVSSPGDGVLDAANGAARRAGPAGLGLLFLVSLLLAVVTEPFQIACVRFLEGYWGGARGTRAIRDIAVERQRRRMVALQEAADHAAGTERDSLRSIALRSRLEVYPNDEDKLLPTVLGNALRAGELQAGERYGLNTIHTWPRIFGRASEDLRLAVAELHEQIDAGARLTVALGLAGAVSAPVLLVRGWWNVVTLVTLTGAWIAYLGAVNAAKRLNVLLAAVFDLHRFDLLIALHLPLPSTHAIEVRFNQQLSDFLAGQRTSPLPSGRPYRHS